MTTRRLAAMTRDWGPIGLCAAAVGVALLWLGITACDFNANFDVEGNVDIDIDIGGGGDVGDGGGAPSAPDEAFLGLAQGPSGLVRLTERFITIGDHYEPRCEVQNEGFAGRDVLDVERVTFGDEGEDFQFFAIVRRPDSELSYLGRRAADGTEVDIPLPAGFEAGSLSVDPDTYVVYIAEMNGSRIATVDPATSETHVVTPVNSGVPAVQRAGDVRVVAPRAGQRQVWVADQIGRVVVLDRSARFMGSIPLEMSHVRIDHQYEGLVDAITDNWRWEIEVDHGFTTLIDAITQGATISTDELGHVGFTARADTSQFAAFVSAGGHGHEIQRFDPGLLPVTQIVTSGETYVVLHDPADSSDAGIVVCPRGSQTVVMGATEMSRNKRSGLSPPPVVPFPEEDRPIITIRDAAVDESDGGNFVIELSAESSHEVRVNVTRSAGTATAGQDFMPGTETIVFAPGETRHDFSCGVVDDPIDEDNESLVATLADPVGAIIAGFGQAECVILDDDPMPNLTMANRFFVEGNGVAQVAMPVTLDTFSGRDITLAFTVVAGGTAVPGVHFNIVTPSPLTIRAGDAFASVLVDIIGDTTDQPDRSFQLSLTPVNATTGTPSPTMTITDDDEPPPGGTVAVTVRTTPVDLAIMVDGGTFTGSTTFLWAPDSMHTLVAQGTFNLADRRYRFLRWSDGVMTATRNVVASTPTEYVALYAVDYRLTVNTTPGGTITIIPLSESGYYAENSFVNVVATPNANFVAVLGGFDDLEGPRTGIVRMTGPRTVSVTFVPIPPP